MRATFLFFIKRNYLQYSESFVGLTLHEALQYRATLTLSSSRFLRKVCIAKRNQRGDSMYFAHWHQFIPECGGGSSKSTRKQTHSSSCCDFYICVASLSSPPQGNSSDADSIRDAVCHLHKYRYSCCRNKLHGVFFFFDMCTIREDFIFCYAIRLLANKSNAQNFLGSMHYSRCQNLKST
jgi:hypothetical protein